MRKPITIVIFKMFQVGIMKRIIFLGVLLLMSTFVFSEEIKQSEITIYKSPYCACCTKWATHLTENGLSANEIKVDNVAQYKKQFGIPEELYSCHTGMVGGYVIEGHVPAEDVNRLLKEKPDIKGLALGGMPIGSPGMEMGDRKDRYDVIAIKKDGSTYVFSTHNDKKE